MSFECPYCNKHSRLPYPSGEWLQRFGGDGGTCLVLSECCNEPIEITQRISYKVVKYAGDRKHDDWGRKFKDET